MVKLKNYFFAAIIIALIFIDQTAKYFAAGLPEAVPVIKNVFYLAFVKNSGIIFGAFPGFNSLLVWIYVIVLGLLLYFYNEFPKDNFSRVMLAFLFAGIIGNLIDRIAFGYVIDFLDFRIWPVFNVADICLDVGILGIIGKAVWDSFKRK